MLTNALQKHDAPSDGHSDALSAKADLNPSGLTRSHLQVLTGRTNEQSVAPVFCVHDEFLGALVDVTPVDAVRRRAVGWDGGVAEIIQGTTHDKLEVRFRAPFRSL